MASLAEIIRKQSRLSLAEIVHLQRLTANANMLADFCFSDLLLFVPRSDPEAVDPTSTGELLVVGHVRPSTTQTLYRHDMIGEVVSDGELRLLPPRSSPSCRPRTQRPSRAITSAVASLSCT